MRKMNKNNLIIGKNKEEIYFAWISGRKLPRLLCNYGFSSPEERRELKSMPRLFRCRYRGSIIKRIRREYIDEQTLETWAELGFYPKERFNVLIEFYDPVNEIAIEKSLPIISTRLKKKSFSL
jgi:hypothetical protein